jgi:hypothetical protein
MKYESKDFHIELNKNTVLDQDNDAVIIKFPKEVIDGVLERLNTNTYYDRFKYDCDGDCFEITDESYFNELLLHIFSIKRPIRTYQVTVDFTLTGNECDEVVDYIHQLVRNAVSDDDNVDYAIVDIQSQIEESGGGF